MLLKINSALVAEKSKKKYGMTLTGQRLFPSGKIEFKAGDWAYVIKGEQTQKRDDKGILQVLDKPIPINLITAVFATKQEALAAVVEERTTEAEIAAAVNDVAKSFGLTPEMMKQLEGAAI